MSKNNSLGANSGSREPSPSGLGPTGFDPGRYAAELTPMQRTSLRAFCERVNSPWGYYATDVGANGAACAALERKGLLTGGLFPGDRTRAYRWTKRGQQVSEAIAMETQRAETPKSGSVAKP